MRTTFERVLLAVLVLPLFSALALAQRVTSSAIPASGSEHRFRILANVAYNASGISFSDNTTFTSYLEDATSTRSYDGGAGVVFEVGAIVGITGPLGVMGSVEIYNNSFDAQFQESLPHPLYFNQPRTVDGSATGLEYKENAVHLDAVFTRELDKVTVDLFGGPTFFFTTAEILDTIDVTSTYPFDEATVSGTTTRKIDDNPIGFNAGGSVTWRLTDVVGIAFQARYSKGTIQLVRDSGSTIDLDAGGFRVGGGIRLAF